MPSWRGTRSCTNSRICRSFRMFLPTPRTAKAPPRGASRPARKARAENREPTRGRSYREHYSRISIAAVMLERGNLVVDLVVDATFDVIQAMLHIVESVGQSSAQFLARTGREQQRCACADCCADRDQTQGGQDARVRARATLQANHAEDVVQVDVADATHELCGLLRTDERAQSPQRFADVPVHCKRFLPESELTASRGMRGLQSSAKRMPLARRDFQRGVCARRVGFVDASCLSAHCCVTLRCARGASVPLSPHEIDTRRSVISG